MGIYIKFYGCGKLKCEQWKLQQIYSHWGYETVEWNSSFVEVQIRAKVSLVWLAWMWNK